MESWVLMYQARLMALVVQMEAMKADNDASRINGELPKWSSDHFNGLANDCENIATTLQ